MSLPTSPTGHTAFGDNDASGADVRRSIANAKLAEARAVEKEMQNDRRSGRLIGKEQAATVIAKLGGGVRSALLRLPDELTEGLEPALAAEINTRINRFLAKRMRPLFETALDSVDVITDPYASKNATKVAVADGGNSGLLGD